MGEGMMIATDFKDITWPAALLGIVAVIAIAAIIIAWIKAMTK